MLKKIKNKDFVYNTIFFTVVFALLICSKIYLKPIIVSGHSMDTTLDNGMFGYSLLVKKDTPIARGDIVIVKTDDHYIIKRVIALPGETIQCLNGDVYINDEKLEEDYISTETEDFEQVTLLNDEYFVMGDNRSNSKDSREIGPVTKDEIISKNIFVLNSIKKFGLQN